ncbi:MAG: T9SS type A sorting domain-containing protein [Bacteroidetes bacterium]|nr:MAG: T9SS type A sorting domain-containing protein [Bacteroidota bacterium]
MKKIYFLFLLLVCVSITLSAQLVYKDVAGIFYSRCTGCHHLNGGAPFSMMNYSEIYPWASWIQTDLNTGKMPPWPPDTTYTRFLHERIITQTEKNDILNWISGGVQKGDTTLAPVAPVYTKHKLKGTPDLILKMPAFPSNATTADVYNCFAIPTGLTVDRILRAYEIVPNNPGLIHHTVVKVDTTGTVNSNLSGGCFNEPGDFGIGGYAPGTPPVIFSGQAPLKIGIRIKAGSKLISQQHYPAGSGGLIDSTEIRLYFYPVGTTGVRPVYANTFLTNWLMSIPANTVKTYTAQYPTSGTLTTAISIYATSPHAHKVNKSMLVYGFRASPLDTIPLIHIPNWDFEWQGMYVHKNMVKIPAGYKLGSKHIYDNTTNNPNNPNNPPQLVSAGTSTTNEMLFDSFQWMYYQTGDENIDIGNLLGGDSLLLSANGPAISAETITSYVYPNPLCESGTLIVTNEQVANCTLKLFDIYGKEVSMDVIRKADAFIIHRGNLPSGIYFYTLHSGKVLGEGKIVLLPE